MENNEKDVWLDWALELQGIAQAGLYYSHDVFDRERFQKVRDIAAQMIASRTDLPLARAVEIFCSERGYQTPKIDTRGAIVRDGKILLVRENNGTWALPGGWEDPGISVGDNVVKEVREEAGLEVSADRIIAFHDRSRHNPKVYPFKICAVYILCTLRGGTFQENIETTASAWFGPDELPNLALEKNTAAQIRMCIRAAESPNWITEFD